MKLRKYSKPQLQHATKHIPNKVYHAYDWLWQCYVLNQTPPNR